jgi:hypothetical protein
VFRLTERKDLDEKFDQSSDGSSFKGFFNGVRGRDLRVSEKCPDDREREMRRVINIFINLQ